MSRSCGDMSDPVSANPMNDSLPQRILLVQYSAFLSGSAVSGRMVAEALLARGCKVLVVFGHEGPCIDLFKSIGCEVAMLPTKNWLRTLSTPHTIRNLFRERKTSDHYLALIRKFKPDLVYVNSFTSYAGALAARRAGVPLVWHLRELYEPGKGDLICPPWFLNLYVRKIARRWPRILAGNAPMVIRSLLGSDPAPRARVVWNAVPDHFFTFETSRAEARKKLGLDPAARIVGLPGSVRRVKGHDLLLRCVARLVGAHPDLKVAFAGAKVDDFYGEVKELVGELGLGDRVSFLGVREDVECFFRACDIIAVPSRTEPFGRVLIEAYAIGTPVVSFAVGGIPEFTTNNTHALLVPPQDEAGFCVALERLLNDPAEGQRLAAHALALAREKFTAEIYIQSMMEQFRDALR